MHAASPQRQPILPLPGGCIEAGTRMNVAVGGQYTATFGISKWKCGLISLAGHGARRKWETGRISLSSLFGRLQHHNRWRHSALSDRPLAPAVCRSFTEPNPISQSLAVMQKFIHTGTKSLSGHLEADSVINSRCPLSKRQ